MEPIPPGEYLRRQAAAVVQTLQPTRQHIKILDGQTIWTGDVLPKDSPPDKPFACPQECETCFNQFYPVIATITDEQARHIIDPLVGAIQSDLAFLRQALSEHADLIVTRWKKKSRAKRVELLEQNTQLFEKKWAPVHLLDRMELRGPRTTRLSPSESRGHNVTLGLCEKELHTTKLAYDTVKDHLDTWFLPYLNVEMLAESHTTFLHLLHLRTLFEPGRWRLFDKSQLALLEHFLILPPLFNKHCVVMEGQEFGKLVPWELGQIHRQETFGFANAHLVLTAERRMMCLLRNCVTALLAVPACQPKLTHQPKWTLVTRTGMEDTENKLAWPRGTINTIARPFFTPYHVASLVISRYREAKDHLELLQTDLEYLQHHVNALASSYILEGSDGNLKWVLIADDLLLEAIRREAFWRQLFKESHAMMALFPTIFESPAGHSPQVDEARDMFHLTTYWLQDFCISFFAHMRLRLDMAVTASRAFENSFEYLKNSRPGRLQKRPILKGDQFNRDLLLWSLNTLGYDENRDLTMHPSFNFAIVEDLCRSDPKRTESMGQRIFDLVADMSVLCDIISNISIQRIRDRQSIPMKVWDKKKAHNSQKQFFLKLERLIDLPTGDRMARALAMALREACASSWPKNFKSKSWLEKATAAHEGVDRLWTAVREMWTAELRNSGVSKQAIDEDLTMLSESRSEEHLAKLADERQSFYDWEHMREQEKEQALVEERQGMSQTIWGHDQPSIAARHVASKHDRVATHRQSKSADDLDDSSEVRLTVDHSLLCPHTIAVSKTTLAILGQMFSQNTNEHRRSFSWQHFLSAMTDAGFSVAQNHGSAVTFKLSGNEDKAIVFHRPHPVATVNPVMLRAMGKRLTKWFGWHKELFVERTK